MLNKGDHWSLIRCFRRTKRLQDLDHSEICFVILWLVYFFFSFAHFVPPMLTESFGIFFIFTNLRSINLVVLYLSKSERKKKIFRLKIHVLSTRRRKPFRILWFVALNRNDSLFSLPIKGGNYLWMVFPRCLLYNGLLKAWKVREQWTFQKVNIVLVIIWFTCSLEWSDF